MIPAPVAAGAETATEEHHAPVSEAFAAKPTGAVARSPISFSNKRTRLIAILVALAIVVVGALVILPGGDAKGSPLAFKQVKGDTLDYHVKISIDGSASGEALGQKDFTLDMEGDIGMRVVGVGADGVATVATTTDVLYVAVDPRNLSSEVVPETVQGEFQVAPDGRVSIGSTGLAGATVGLAPPGWDGLYPVLPPTVTEAGDTWSEDVTIPFAGRESLTAEADYTLLEVKEKGGKEVAVVSAVVKVPIDISTTFRELLAATGGEVPADLPEDFNPTYAVEGDMDLETTYWIDADGVLQSNYTVGTVEFTTTRSGVPGAEDEQIAISGDMTVSTKQVAPKPAPAGEPAADKSPSVEVD